MHDIQDLSSQPRIKAQIPCSGNMESLPLDWKEVPIGTLSWLSHRQFVVYLIYMQSTSCEMKGWMTHKLESRLLAEISVTTDRQTTPPLWQKVKRNLKASWWKWEESEKAGLKLKIHKTKIMASSFITSWQIDGETMETVTDFIFLGSKITANCDCTMKLKDICSLEEKLWQIQFSSAQFSCSVVSDSLQPHGLQQFRLPCPSPIPGIDSNSCPLSWWCHPTISSSVIPFSSCLQSFPASGSFLMSQFFASHGQILEFQFQHQSFQWIFRTYLLEDGLVGSPCYLRDSQESFPTPLFKSINSLVLSFLYSPTLTSIYDYWKNHSLD